MKILVFGGSGKIGSAVAWDLVKDQSVEKVGLVGRKKLSLEQTKKWIGCGKIELHALDIADKKELASVMKNYDAGVIALPDRMTSYIVAETAVNAGLSIVDMLEEYHRRPDEYEIEGLKIPGGMNLNQYGDYLHETAVKNGVTFLDGIGFAPGLSNITLGKGIDQFDSVESAIARVGGIPSKEAASKHPLKYMITWAFKHVLREYMVKLKVLKGGKVIEVNATTGREKFLFNKFGKNEELECAITPGMPSFIYTRPNLKEFAEKTVRWPGHWSGIDTLKECGLLDLKPVAVDECEIAPRDFLLSVIEPKLMAREGETDVCVMWNSIIGTKDGRKKRIDYYMWDEADTANNISSMARVTGFPSAVGAIFIGQGKINEKGIVPPEDGIKGKVYDDFIAELEKRNIVILEEEKFVE